MRIYWTNEHLNNKLGMMARPRGNDWLEDDIKKLLLNEVDTVVSLLELSEIRELGLSKEEEFCQAYGIQFINYPIPDRGLPESRNSFKELLLTLDQNLQQNKKVVVHCRMGIGRTSMICAGLLIRNGVCPQDVFKLLSKTRTLQVPDTVEQAQWINDLSRK